MTSRTFIFLALALQVTWSIPLKQGIGGKLSGSVGGGIRAAVEGGIGTGIKGAEKLNTEMGGGYSGEGGASVKGAGGISGGGSLGGLGGYSGEGGASINGVGGFSGSGSIGGLGDYSRDVGASIEGLGGKIRSAVRGGSSVGAKMEGSSSKAAGMKGNVDLDVGKELGFSSGIRLFGSGIGEGSLNGGISGTGQVEMSKATGLETNKGMGFDKLEKLNGGSKVAKSETGNSEVETGRNKESSGQSGLRIDGKYNINSQIQGRSTDDEKITDGATNEANLKIGNEKEGNGNVEMTGNTNKETSVGESESSLEANVDLNALGASIQALIDGGKIDLDGIDYQQLALLASNLIDLGELGMGGNLELQGQGSTGTSLDLEKLTALLQNGLVNAGGSLSVNAGGLRGLGGGAGGQGGLGGGAGGQGGFGGAAEGRVGLGGTAGGQGGLGGAAGGQGGLGGAAGVQVGLGGAGGSVNLSPSLLRRAIQLGLFPMKFLSSGLSGAANSWGNLRSGGILGAKHQAGFTGQLLPNIKAKMSGNAGGEQRLSAIGGSEVNLNGRGGGGFRLLGSAPSLGWNVQTPRVKFNVGLNRKPEINRDLNSNVEVATNVKSHSKTS